jgi:hypothetical protein
VRAIARATLSAALLLSTPRVARVESVVTDAVAAPSPAGGNPKGRIPRSYAGVSIDASLLRSGDLIFREGRSRDSDMVMWFDRASPFSHVGLIEVAGDEVQVIHIVPGNRAKGLDVALRESLKDFLAPTAAAAIAVYRVAPQHESVVAEAVLAASSYVERRVPFDDEFDTNQPDALYCTELVWRAYAEAGLDLIDGKLESLTFPLARGSYVLLSSLRSSPHLHEVLSITESAP